MIQLTKLVTALVMPLGFVTGLLCLVLLRRAMGWLRGETALLALALAILVIASSPIVASALVEHLESRYAPLAAAPVSDVIVVLGGVVEPASAPRLMPDLSAAADRLTYAARLYTSGKAPVILVSSGKFDWQSDEPAEAETMAEVLGWLGVPRSAIVLETRSRNTAENARFTAEIWRRNGYQSGLLVTSAIHMPRAHIEFQRVGLSLVPAPADIWVSAHSKKEIWRGMPNSGSLHWTTAALKEYLGLAVQKFRSR